MNQNKPTEGELFIEAFLKSKRIKCQTQKRIDSLKNDSKSHRVADFYLPNYKVYMEFQGLWNNTPEQRLSYKEKMLVYANNELPCMYLYPENLGIMEYIFHIRLLEVLKKFGLQKELVKYKIWRFLNEKQGLLIWFLVLFYYMIVGYDDAKPDTINETIYFFAFFSEIIITVKLILGFNKYYIKEM
jgi:hypothetical protein